MILTVTLNPALDKIIILDNLKLGKLNRVKETTILAGGKGINVSEVLTELKIDNKALGIVGGNNGRVITSMLEKKGVKSDFIWSDFETRVNLKVKEKNINRETEINEGGKVSKENIDDFKAAFEKKVKKNKTLVLSGSLPAGVEKNIYAELINKAKENDARVILDSSGEEFKLALKMAPYLVKPNLEEIENLLGRKINNNDDLKKGARYLLEQGVNVVMISLGEKGAFIASEEEGYRIYTPQVKVSQTTVGAGDTMVAGLAAEIDKNESLKDTGIFAAALATAFVESGSISRIDEELIERIKNSIKVEKVY
ncbi:fructose-1-phosphate kinase [Halanaerobium saccharolyticum]|uniref:Tagatose-6-phosphate kinase n=1 Tax=Halanaerobium saccharolyticum TaxID=43595 RepID=A0A4R7YUY9_9FIRM|nr:1-phosphofructokinase [Halanaerobium saccharolyticum]RAK06915.1 fructose-1-phosphate kinase [Halanaerobium saccharolyticum]TDW01642.1 fructose-1-phosphate kinase [Halanaerobium saccharolyticum]TDX53040.1 fructose-1-phosphate kinase [Halanaerobium saccharolyticum]